ncbi:MAG TPA: type II toxin-antitoxin system RelB/DinJ family antitoxin [Methylomirabilota bacterium]|nr:type II toxin-antitoxin system RelB/DinJ family antitoxin [Methylomirabilota bacterium]
MNYTVVTTKIDPQMKKEAMETADALGMPLSVVIKAFLKQFIRTRSVYFSADGEEPTTYLLESLHQSEKDKTAGKVTSFTTGKAALDYLDAEIANEKQNK